MTERGSNAVHQVVRIDAQEEVSVELSWHALTHVGHRREINQDSYVAVPPIFAVADGMGGHAAGEIASQAVVRRLGDAAQGHVTRTDLEKALTEAVDDIALQVNDAELGTGTTVTGVLLEVVNGQPVWSAFNIGDSRVYLSFEGKLSRLTIDHSVVQHLIDTGQISPEEAEFHPHSNVITRAVGINEEPLPDYASIEVQPGQRLLICSDGLTKELTDGGILHYLAKAETAESAAEDLMRESLGNAGRDNITVMVIDVHSVNV